MQLRSCVTIDTKILVLHVGSQYNHYIDIISTVALGTITIYVANSDSTSALDMTKYDQWYRISYMVVSVSIANS